MRVVITAHVYDEENLQLTVETREVESDIGTLRHDVRWADIGYEVVTAALDKARTTAAGMVCPDAD